MNIIETTQLIHLITENPILTFLTVVATIYMPCQALLYAWSRFLRHRNVSKHGWPPAHCDADGYPVETPTDNE